MRVNWKEKLEKMRKEFEANSGIRIEFIEVKNKYSLLFHISPSIKHIVNDHDSIRELYYTLSDIYVGFNIGYNLALKNVDKILHEE